MQPYIPPTPDYRLKMMNPDPTTTPVKTTKTYREYLNEVIVQEGVFVAVASQTLKEMRRKEGTNISEAGYNKILTDMTACLEKDMKAYAAWNDPKLNDNITTKDVSGLKQLFVDNYLHKSDYPIVWDK